MVDSVDRPEALRAKYRDVMATLPVGSGFSRTEK
jgi:hypothetical protein